MSIWAPGASIGYDFDAGEFSDERGLVRSYPEGFSNSYPMQGDVIYNPAGLVVASIPAWCAGGADDDWTSVGPWIRLEVASPHAPDYWHATEDGPQIEALGASVVLDEQAVRSLVDSLTEWLDRPKVQPDSP